MDSNHRPSGLKVQKLIFSRSFPHFSHFFCDISDEIEILTDRLKAIENAGRTAEELEAKQQKLRGAIEQMKTCCVEYDEQAVRQMIECIRAYPDGKLEIIFGGGYTVTEQME